MPTTKIFFDTEFTGLHQGTTLISIGIFAESGESFYAELTDYDKKQVDAWINENVIANLSIKSIKVGFERIEDGTGYIVRGDSEYVGRQLYAWLKQFDFVKMWSDCLAYDWVLFCELFGGALYIPGNVYYIPFDICTMFAERDIDPDVNREEFAEMTGPKHNALFDAKVIKACYEKMKK